MSQQYNIADVLSAMDGIRDMISYFIKPEPKNVFSLITRTKTIVDGDYEFFQPAYRGHPSLYALKTDSKQLKDYVSSIGCKMTATGIIADARIDDNKMLLNEICACHQTSILTTVLENCMQENLLKKALAMLHAECKMGYKHLMQSNKTSNNIKKN